MEKRHLILPDCQIRPGDNLDFLTAIGNYLVDKKPDVFVNLGDFSDFPSLSSYDVGKKSFEGRRYKDDVDATNKAMDVLLEPLYAYNKKAKTGHRERYNPQKILTLGNHCNRVNRAVNDDPKLDGVLSLDDLNYKKHGWEVHPFLDVVVVDGVAYSHYFVTGVAGRPAGSAQAQLRKTNMSSVAGHQQGIQVATGSRADGKRLTAIIAGSCYEHDEAYLGPQGNNHFRGIIMLHEVDDGEFDAHPISLNFLKRKYL